MIESLRSQNTYFRAQFRQTSYKELVFARCEILSLVGAQNEFVYGSSIELGFECGSNGARTIAESPFDKPGERHKINSCVNEINSLLCSLSKVNPLALW